MMMRDSDAMRHRPWWRVLRQHGAWLLGVAVISAAPLGAQARGSTASRDTTVRTWRIQMRNGETTHVRVVVSPERLRLKLDSLQRVFDDKDAHSPDRRRIEREIVTMVRALEEHFARAAGGARVSAEIDARLNGEIARSLATHGGPRVFLRAHAEAMPKGWIGINVEAPQRVEIRDDTAYIRYFTYPQVVSVEPNSPAEKVGISRGDRLVAYNGADVRIEPVNVTRLLRPDSRVTVTISRDGAMRDFPLVVAKAPLRFVERRQSSGDGVSSDGEKFELFGLPQRTARVATGSLLPTLHYERLTETAPLAGASLAAIKSESLGRYFGVASGILVTSVFGDPAAASGLQEGDVILRADGKEVATVLQLRRLVDAHSSERSIELSLLRHRKPVTLTLRW